MECPASPKVGSLCLGCPLHAGHDAAPCSSLHSIKLHRALSKKICSPCRTSTRWLQGPVLATAGFTWMSLPSSRCCSAVVSSLSISSSLKATVISTAESWSLAAELLSSSSSLQEATSFWTSMLQLSLHAAGGPTNFVGTVDNWSWAVQWVNEPVGKFKGWATRDDLIAIRSCTGPRSRNGSSWGSWQHSDSGVVLLSRSAMLQLCD